MNQGVAVLSEARFNNEVRYRLLKLVQAHPEWSQRQIALAIGVSLGKVNYCLRGLTELGFVRVVRFARSQNKRDYRYLLTPKGIAEKTIVTAKCLVHKEKEFESIQTEIAALKRELDGGEVRGSR